MSTAKALLKNKFLNGWYLFTLVSLPITALVIWNSIILDLSQPENVSYMIGYAVRFAIPIIFLIVAISGLQILFPNILTAWLMRNRKYIGLMFAVAMFWQGFYILIISTVHRPYYFENIFYFKDELEGTIGYILMGAMVITSFYFARKRITKDQWDLIHKSGMYFLWAYPFSTYWWAVSNYYGEGYAEFKHYSLYWMGLIAMLIRIAAWGKQRLRRSKITEVPMANKAIAFPLIAVGFATAAAPMYYQPVSSEFLYNIQWIADTALWMPFFPFDPFLPFILIWLGTRQLTTHNKISTARVQATGRA